MRNKWLVIIGSSVVLGLLLSLMLEPRSTNKGPYLALDPGHRAAVEIPDAIGFEKIPLVKRISGATTPVATFYYTFNLLAGIDKKPLALSLAVPPAGIQNILQELPISVRAKLAQKLICIYLTAGLGWPATTTLAYRTLEAAQTMGAIVALDLTSFQSTPRVWLTLDQWFDKRENALFAPRKGNEVEGTLSPDTQGSDAMEYALLRELGQVFAIDTHVFPNDQDSPLLDGDEQKFPFLALSWQITKGKPVIRPEWEFKHRAALDPASRVKLDSGRQREVYDQLEKTNFPTTVAALSPFDDFAESFASYVHVEIFHRPLELRVVQNGKIVKILHSCWSQPRCLKKREFFKKLLTPDAS
ncbi:MAG: hypothetical protein HY074_01925 [Deltaproteobacteria bacterium]|nr:hypothetical protein [Deltaproteobacteria bacterium]